jgi:hypothetical protein
MAIKRRAGKMCPQTNKNIADTIRKRRPLLINKMTQHKLAETQRSLIKRLLSKNASELRNAGRLLKVYNAVFQS